MGTGNQLDSSACATVSVPACRSAPSVAQLWLLENSDTVCSACGHGGEPFHRLKHDGKTRYFCSSCILFLYKGMYCCLCLVVYETPGAKGDSSLWVSCAKCHRIAHKKCASNRDLHMDSEFTCPKCFHCDKALAQDRVTSTEGRAGNGSPLLKRLQSSSDDQIACAPSLGDQKNSHRSPEEVLAAAQIVALLAVQHAKDAKARARASAAVAARAAACAKVALDTAYRAAQEEARWKPESSRRLAGVLPGSNGGLPSLSAISAPHNMGVQGGVTMHSRLSNMGALSHKDQLGKGQSTSESARGTAQCNTMKALPPRVEVSGAQKAQEGSLQEALDGVRDGGSNMESEAVNISASPASILDASISLDTPRPSSSAEPGQGHCSLPDAVPKASSSSTTLSRDDLSGMSTHLQASKDQLSPLDKKH